MFSLCGKRVMMTGVEGRGRKGRLKQRWMDSVNVDLREKGLSGEETQNYAVWRQLVRYLDPIEVVNDGVEEEEVTAALGLIVG